MLTHNYFILKGKKTVGKIQEIGEGCCFLKTQFSDTLYKVNRIDVFPEMKLRNKYYLYNVLDDHLLQIASKDNLFINLYDFFIKVLTEKSK